ncbi:unnamed protein product [Arctia plantaginis]|uniref:Uncharacterized protein n=1 Tax=Arctia plantaginis TaxID=874455 RepID=A0A8S0YRM5_ARCPL|nr:unnamed protein product [Arctia plantaginis]CAB3261419.1 unnamed protein product [Arctia plantaginis]
MMLSLVLLLATCTCLVNSLPPPHPDVEAVRKEEELLHPLQRSQALRNPHLLKILPLSSLLHEGEKLVFARDAHDVSREEIYKILTHAGLIPRRLRPHSSEPTGLKHNEVLALFPEEHLDFDESLYLQNQDLLQYL